MNVLLSIKPQFAARIFNGEKKYEYRKVIFANEDVKRIFIYASAPVKKIIGEIEVDEILNETPKTLWRLTSEFAGISSRFFFEYFSGRESAYAIKIRASELFKNPIDPYNTVDGFRPPQSFTYLVKGKLLSKLICENSCEKGHCF